MKKYWFYLEEYVYVNIKSKFGLVYSTLSGDLLIIKSKEIIGLLKKIYVDENLGCIQLTSNDLSNDAIRKFVDNVLRLKLGNLIDTEINPVKPIILLPILSLNLDVDKFIDKENKEFLLSKNISRYLLDINIILNTSCSQTCKKCEYYHEQFFHCLKNNSHLEIDKKILSTLFDQIDNFPIKTINLTGGDIYHYKNLDSLMSISEKSDKKFNFYIHYLNYQPNTFIDSSNLHILINGPIDYAKLEYVCKNTCRTNVVYHIIVENENQYDSFVNTLSSLGIQDYIAHPFYNTENYSFFQNNIYVTKDDILESPISMQQIHRNQKVNANSFGSLYILPNGDVKANLNDEVLGNLLHQDILSIIYAELIRNTAWRQVRAGNRCSDCIFQYICSPISNYERVIKRNDLCTINIENDFIHI